MPIPDRGGADRSLCRFPTPERGSTLDVRRRDVTADRRDGAPADPRTGRTRRQDTMSVGLPVEVPAAPARRSDVLAEPDPMQARATSAEERAAGLERALTSSRRISIAIGILLCRHQLTEDQAVAVLEAHSQRHDVTVRELAETVICTETLWESPARIVTAGAPACEPPGSSVRPRVQGGGT
jgi:hypothetical protein